MLALQVLWRYLPHRKGFRDAHPHRIACWLRHCVREPVGLISEPLAIYVHVPFCPSKCGYCDFNSYSLQGPVIERTVAATIREIEQSPAYGRPAKTIFFGGGTPTYLSAEQLLSVFDSVLRAHPPVDGCEITSEANPGTADADKFAAMRRAGFDRLSLGAQSFLDDDLITLGRVHRAGEIERAVGLAREAGFDNLNLDLMFALPHQSMVGWQRNLERALALQPEHLSLYCLTIEPKTAFYQKHLKGTLVVPGEDDQVAMYESCTDLTAQAGFAQYEISNYALPGRECKHNLCYWFGEEYAGYGPGAVGAVTNDSGVRTRKMNLRHPDQYASAVEQGASLAHEEEALDEDTLRTERIMLGLRLNQGIPREGFDQRSLDRVIRRGWVDLSETHVRLTREGRHFCTEVAVELA